MVVEKQLQVRMEIVEIASMGDDTVAVDVLLVEAENDAVEIGGKAASASCASSARSQPGGCERRRIGHPADARP